MQFERNALSSSIITSPAPFHASSNINALKYNLFQRSLNDTYDITPSTTSSEEGNSPTELNNCRRILEKPPLVSASRVTAQQQSQLMLRSYFRFS